MKLIECPRDAMQGLHNFIPTQTKIEYINDLLQVGFDTLDVGSFVSPKAIPQMKDTADVLDKLDLSDTETKLSVIVANSRGAKQAINFEQIDFLGYPFSISETFQIRNTNATIEESLVRVEEIQKICLASDKKLIIYISMGFGNPYGDEWRAEIVHHWVQKLSEMGIRIFQLSDTVGVASVANISYLFENLLPAHEDLEIGAHFHTTLKTWEEKVQSAYNFGCRRFDGTIMGFGGCPMAQNDLVGNMPTEFLIQFASQNNIELSLNMSYFYKAMGKIQQIFG